MRVGSDETGWTGPSGVGEGKQAHAVWGWIPLYSRMGRPATSVPAMATALVAASTVSKSTNPVPLNSPSRSINLIRVISPQSENAALSLSSVMVHERLPTCRASGSQQRSVGCAKSSHTAK